MIKCWDLDLVSKYSLIRKHACNTDSIMTWPAPGAIVS